MKFLSFIFTPTPKNGFLMINNLFDIYQLRGLDYYKHKFATGTQLRNGTEVTTHAHKNPNGAAI